MNDSLVICKEHFENFGENVWWILCVPYTMKYNSTEEDVMDEGYSEMEDENRLLWS